MTIRPGHATKKSQGAATKSSTKGLDVVKMNEFESRHYPNKNRSYSPFSPMGSPTTPLNFEQLFLQAQLPMGSSGELPTHRDQQQPQQPQQQQGMVQVQLMHSIRDSGLATKAHQAQNLLMLEHLRQTYNRGGEQEEAEWNARALAAAAQHHQQEKQQHQQLQQPSQPLSNDISTPLHNEPSSIALLQQRFTQLERHKAELQKSGQVMDLQLYPSQWPSSSSALPTTTQSCSPLQQSCGSLQQLPESRHYTSNNAGCFYPLPLQQQQPQHQQIFASGLPDHGAHEMFFPAKKESPSWRPTQLNSNPPSTPTPPPPPPPTITRSSAPTPPPQTNWAHHPEMQGVRAYMYFPQQQQQILQQQQMQHRQPKGGEFRNTFMGGDGLEFGGGAKQQQQQFSSSNLGPSVQASPDMRMLSSVVVSSRCDKTGGHSVEIKSGPEQYCSSDESEMSLDNFSGRLSTQMQGSPVASNAAASQIAFNNFQLLPQSNKSAFSTFTRPGQYMPSSESQECGVTTRSLLFNDTYSSKRTQEPLEMHDDIDTTLHL